jgi:hypothetical protein
VIPRRRELQLVGQIDRRMPVCPRESRSRQP